MRTQATALWRVIVILGGIVAVSAVIGGILVVQELTAQKLADPIGITAVVPHPGQADEVIVVLQGGQIVRASLEASEAELFGDLSGRLADDLKFEEGLLGLAFSPEFEEDAAIYVDYTAGKHYAAPGETAEKDARRNVIARFTVRDGRLDEDSEEVLIEINQPAPVHNGGHLAFGPDGYLYIGTGDGGGQGDPHEMGQDTTTLLGAILRIDVVGRDDYTIPPGNPFAGSGGAPEIFAYGFRNPWRFSFDSETGAMYASDVGHNRWEEVDRVVSGGKYGWDCFEGFESYEAQGCEGLDWIKPLAVYGHDEGCSITGGYVYRGIQHPELLGHYLYSDYCSGTLWGLDVEMSGATPRTVAESGLNVTAFAQLPDGELLIAGQNQGVYRVPDLEQMLPGTASLLERAGVIVR